MIEKNNSFNQQSTIINPKAEPGQLRAYFSFQASPD
jgi:hypothetical protein